MKISVLSVLALAILLFATPSMAAIKCSDVLSDLAPCRAYLTKGGFPSKDCCSGVSKLVAAASTTPDRRAACTCLVDAAKKTKPNIAAAIALPGSCGITLPGSFSLSIDCSNPAIVVCHAVGVWDSCWEAVQFTSGDGLKNIPPKLVTFTSTASHGKFKGLAEACRSWLDVKCIHASISGLQFFRWCSRSKVLPDYDLAFTIVPWAGC